VTCFLIKIRSRYDTMNQTYQGKYLTIKHCKVKSLFIQNWNPSPKTLEDFKFEMLAYTAQYKKHRPKNTLWLQQNFEFAIDDTTKNWIEQYVNKPCFNYGNEKCAFVVSKDVLVHINTIDVFEKTNSCIIPKHFATEKEAMHWIESTESPKPFNETTNIVYDGVDDKGNIVLKIPTTNIKETFKSLHKSIEQEKFANENREKLQLLTKREKEILKLIAQDKKHQEIADSLFISLNTLRTHWKNIKLKLNFNAEIDIKALSKFLD